MGPTIAPAVVNAVAEREYRVAEATHSLEMEGLCVTAATRTDAQDYIEGLIDSDELVFRTRARYGLE